MTYYNMTKTRELDKQFFKTINHLNECYNDDIARDARTGLTSQQKYIPCKYFYDDYGSKLFEDICSLPEYYQTRTEMFVLREIAPMLMAKLANYDIVELGSGANHKISLLLDAAGEQIRSTLRYIPVDISESALTKASQDLRRRYPELTVLGIIADFTSQLHLLPANRPRMFCFLGGTIGNMENDEAAMFLRNVCTIMKDTDKLLIGFDMVKNLNVIEAAYNDPLGITAEFNKNVLTVINRELEGDFDPDHFQHIAFYNDTFDRIEMHLKANCDVTVKLRSINAEIYMKKGETIHTENSRKFTKKSIAELANKSGLSIQRWYSDPAYWFSLVIMARTKK